MNKRKPLPPDATITLPARLVLDWWMRDDPSSLPEHQDRQLTAALSQRAVELGYDDVIDAYHEGGTE